MMTTVSGLQYKDIKVGTGWFSGKELKDGNIELKYIHRPLMSSMDFIRPSEKKIL